MPKAEYTLVEAKYFHDIPITSTVTVSHTPTTNYLLSLVVPLSPIELPTEAANTYMKLYSSVRDSVIVTNLTHSIEFSMPEIVPARFISGLL